MQRLIHIDRPRTGQLSSEYRGDQRPTPHAMRHHVVECVALGERLIYARGIDVSRQDREYLDVLIGERPDETCRVTRLQLVKRPIFDALHPDPPKSLLNLRNSECRGTSEIFDATREERKQADIH